MLVYWFASLLVMAQHWLYAQLFGLYSKQFNVVLCIFFEKFLYKLIVIFYLKLLPDYIAYVCHFILSLIKISSRIELKKRENQFRCLYQNNYRIVTLNVFCVFENDSNATNYNRNKHLFKSQMIQLEDFRVVGSI